MLTRQEIIKQIQQGKVHSALEGMVQLSGQMRDKDLQQRCVLLQSQLAQLNTNLGLGTLDNASYQLAFNRITQTTLEAAYDLPATPPAYTQQSANSNSYQNQNSRSGWKTWGILLTGGLVVMIILGVVGMMMEDNGFQEGNQQPLNPIQSNLIPDQQPQANTPAASTPTTETRRPATGNKHVGYWEGIMNFGGMTIGGVHIQLTADHQYISRLYDPMSGALMATNQGQWSATESGQLVLLSQTGTREVYQCTFEDSEQFLALLVDGNNPEFLGTTILFAKSDE